MVKPSNILVVKRKEGGRREGKNNRGGAAKPQGDSKSTGLLTGCQIAKTQTLMPINELHKLQLKPRALIWWKWEPVKVLEERGGGAREVKERSFQQILFLPLFYLLN